MNDSIWKDDEVVKETEHGTVTADRHRGDRWFRVDYANGDWAHFDNLPEALAQIENQT